MEVELLLRVSELMRGGASMPGHTFWVRRTFHSALLPFLSLLVLHVVRSTSPEIKVLKKPILVVSLLKAPGGYEQAKRMSGHSETPSVLWPGVPRPSRMPPMDVAGLAEDTPLLPRLCFL